jgi:plastocyanin
MFSPNPLQVPVGARVRATNKETSGVAHSWSADAAQAQQWDSGTLNPGVSSAVVTFPTAGTFAYHCNIHSSMHGTVVVS